jgi:hypothetical protein
MLLFCDSFDHYATAHLPEKWDGTNLALQATSGATIVAGAGRLGSAGIFLDAAGSARAVKLCDPGPPYGVVLGFACQPVFAGGRVLTVTLTQGLNTVTSAGGFVAGDVGKRLHLLNGPSDTISVFSDASTISLANVYAGATVTAPAQIYNPTERFTLCAVAYLYEYSQNPFGAVLIAKYYTYSLQVTPDGRLQVWQEDSASIFPATLLLESSDGALPFGSMSYVELAFSSTPVVPDPSSFLHTYAPGGTVTLRVNEGVVLLTAPVTASQSFGPVYVTLGGGTAEVGQCYIDDLYVVGGPRAATGVAASGQELNPNTWNYNDGFLGSVHVEALVPQTDAAWNLWTPATGTNHYAMVDSIPPDATQYLTDNLLVEPSGYELFHYPSTLLATRPENPEVYALQWVARIAAGSGVGAFTVLPIVVSAAHQWSGSGAFIPLTSASAVMFAHPIDRNIAASQVPWRLADFNGHTHTVDFVQGSTRVAATNLSPLPLDRFLDTDIGQQIRLAGAPVVYTITQYGDHVYQVVLDRVYAEVSAPGATADIYCTQIGIELVPVVP